MSCDGDIGVAIIGGLVGIPVLVTAAGVIIGAVVAGAVVLGGAAAATYGAYKVFTLGGKSILAALERRQQRIANERARQLQSERKRLQEQAASERVAREQRAKNAAAALAKRERPPAKRQAAVVNPWKVDAERLLEQASFLVENAIDPKLEARHAPGLQERLRKILDEERSLIQKGSYEQAARGLQRLINRVGREAASLEEKESRYQHKRVVVYELLHATAAHLESSRNHIVLRHAKTELEIAQSRYEEACERFNQDNTEGLEEAERLCRKLEEELRRIDLHAAEKEAERIRAFEARKRILAAIVGATYEMGYSVKKLAGDLRAEGHQDSPIAVRLVGCTSSTRGKVIDFYIDSSGRMYFDITQGFVEDECEDFLQVFLALLKQRNLYFFNQRVNERRPINRVAGSSQGTGAARSARRQVTKN